MSETNNKDETLKKLLQKILENENLEFHRELSTNQAIELGVSILDYAAALSFLNQTNARLNSRENPAFIDADVKKSKTNTEQTAVLFNPRLVRYRLEIGHKHQVTIEQIKAVLVEVSGVDRNSIGKLEIRRHYTLVDLPDGMSSDIFQLLAETEIYKQRLNIKRVKHKQRYLRRNNRNR